MDRYLFIGSESRMVYITWLLSVCFTGSILLSQVLHITSGIALAPVYWNSSNTFFKQSKNSHTIEVSLQDQIDFVCPYYHPKEHTDTSTYEYYTVYQVSRQNYEDCNISSRESAIMIINCSNPFQHKRYTILFEMFQAIPNAPEFVPGGTYYYVSTSTGHRDGLSNRHQGACQQLNMKLIIYVCCDTRPVESSTASSSSSHSGLTRPAWTRWPASKNSKYFTRKSRISSVTFPFDKSQDIPKQNLGFRKENESYVSPKHQGLTNKSLNLSQLCTNLAIFLPYLMLKFLHYLR